MGYYNIFMIIRCIIKDLFYSKYFKHIFIILLIIFALLFFFKTSNGALETLDTFVISTTEPNTIVLHNCFDNTQTQIIETSAFPVQFMYDSWLIFKPSWTDNYYIYNWDSSLYTMTVENNEHFVLIYNSGGIAPSNSSGLFCNYNGSSFTNVTNSNGNNLSNGNLRQSFYCTNTEIYNRNNYQLTNQIHYNQTFTSDTYKDPTLANNLTDLENLSFENFVINANDFSSDIKNNEKGLVMLIYNRSLSNSQSTDGLYPISEKAFYYESIYLDLENSTDDNLIFNYPIFKSGVLFNVGSTYEIRFAQRIFDNTLPSGYYYEYFGNNYTFTISSNVTQDYINNINSQTAISSDNDNFNNLNNSINSQTQSIDNINNSITDSSVDNSSINLPTDNTPNPTQDGINNIFTSIYNGFTSGTPQNIVFPIPFTNSNITLSPSYIYDMLNNNNANWIIFIVQAFYWYIISRFIILDIAKKIRNIKTGNIENIQNNNIKEDML